MQTKKGSLTESLTNTFSGTALSLGISQLYFWSLGIPFPLYQNIILTTILTIVSIGRGYAVRRLFNMRST